MSKQTLRSLAKDYAKGVIHKDKYRKSRSELIKSIIAGEIAVKAIDYAPPLQPSEEEAAITETNQRDKNKTEIAYKPVAAKDNVRVKQNPPVQESGKSNKKSLWIFIAVSASGIMLLIIAIVMFYPKPAGSTTTDISTAASASASNTIPASSMAGETLIADFLTQKNWSEGSIDQFIAAWSGLTQEQKDTASQTKRMQRMHDSIYKQFLEEKALANIDSAKAILKQQKLIEFATAIGINDSRLVIN